jgi:hypothetical protein
LPFWAHPQTARKHGIADDMFHAVRNPVAQWLLDEDLMMRVGPARGGDLLEMVCWASRPTIP